MGLKQQLKQVTVSLLGQTRYLQLRARYRAVRDMVRLARAAWYDTSSYARGSGLLHPARQEALKAHILKSYHRIEKGLALPVPKPGFGADAIRLLLDDLAVYMKTEPDDWVVSAALETLEEYIVFNRQHAVNVDYVEEALERFRAMAKPVAAEPAHGMSQLHEQCKTGGTMTVDMPALHAAIAIPYAAFVKCRHSVRQFSQQPLDPAHIFQAAELARYAPSVCNRSSGQVYFVPAGNRMNRLLALQNGNRGFGDTAGGLLIITSRTETFHTVGERYQAWIDGGLFSMSLIYALHAQGLGTCCLNWSVEAQADRALKQEAGIPMHDKVIMLLAVGHLPASLTVARSARRPVSEVVTMLDA